MNTRITHTTAINAACGRLHLSSYRSEASMTWTEDAETLELKGIGTIQLLEAVQSLVRSLKYEEAYLAQTPALLDALEALASSTALTLEAARPAQPEKAEA